MYVYVYEKGKDNILNNRFKDIREKLRINF